MEKSGPFTSGGRWSTESIGHCPLPGNAPFWASAGLVFVQPGEEPQRALIKSASSKSWNNPAGNPLEHTADQISDQSDNRDGFQDIFFRAAQR